MADIFVPYPDGTEFRAHIKLDQSGTAIRMRLSPYDPCDDPQVVGEIPMAYIPDLIKDLVDAYADGMQRMILE